MKRKNLQDFEQNTSKKKICFDNIKIKLQLDTESDITIINEKTWKKLSKPSLLTSRKVARDVFGRKLNFFSEFACYISFVRKIKEAMILVLKNTMNIYLKWMVMPYSIFGNWQSICSVTK